MSLGYILCVFLLQIAIFFGKQWYDDKKRNITNLIILGYALYFLCFAVGTVIYFYAIIHIPAPTPFDFYFILSIIIRGSGGVLFSFVMEWRILKKTRYLLTISLTVLLTIIPILYNTLVFTQVLNAMNIIIMGLPLIFNIYFIRLTWGIVRRKLIIASFGFVLIITGLIFSTYNMNIILQSLIVNPAFVQAPAKGLAIFGSILVIYGYYGYSFFFESDWKNNLISLYIIDKTQTKELYHKDFLEGQIERGEMLAGGIAGLAQVIREFTESKKEVDALNLGANFILLAHGSKIITALLVKKNLQHAQYFLKTVTREFEIYYSDFLRYYEEFKDQLSDEEMFKPMELLIRDIIEF